MQDRRQFLNFGLASVIAAAVAPRSSATIIGGPRRVVVIGAGLAGLVAAYELGKTGNDVSVLEAQERPGGRVMTYRGFSEGLYADAGAARIPDNHDLTHKYVKEFGLPLIPFYPDGGKFVRFRGTAYEQVGWDGFREATQMVIGLGDRKTWNKIKGGNDLLPKAFADRLGGKITYGAPAVKIETTSTGVRVKYQKAGRLAEVAGDVVLVAVPFSVISKIEFEPALSEAKRRAINSVEYDSASRVFVETRDRFWQERGLNGFGFGEDAAEIWDASFGEPGRHGLVETYLRGGYSMEMTRTREAERTAANVQKLARLYPDLAARVVKGASKCWSEDPWVLGAWAHPGRAEAEAGRMPEGRIYFAGEHLSGNPSWMQGALESGIRAAKEILAASTAAVTI